MPPPPGYGPGGMPMGEPPASIGSAIGALVANIVGIFLCTPFALIGIILAIIGLATANSSPGTSRGCTSAGWIMFGVGTVIWVGMLLWSVSLS
ncbi:hypothetical protein GCM10009799_37970 [Nocardiopsis rhodophaea]|uniref:DUF4190 domain-containing protein n=1 Tax=Nocardiopsis rhodophaea TaxID=280238 RepID=A0ABP5EUG8_9ACTN